MQQKYAIQICNTDMQYRFAIQICNTVRLLGDQSLLDASTVWPHEVFVDVLVDALQFVFRFSGSMWFALGLVESQ